MRLSELANLKWPIVDLNKGTITFADRTYSRNSARPMVPDPTEIARSTMSLEE